MWLDILRNFFHQFQVQHVYNFAASNSRYCQYYTAVVRQVLCAHRRLRCGGHGCRVGPSEQCSPDGFALRCIALLLYGIVQQCCTLVASQCASCVRFEILVLSAERHYFKGTRTKVTKVEWVPGFDLLVCAVARHGVVYTLMSWRYNIMTPPSICTTTACVA